MIAIGIGCRRNCPADDIAALVARLREPLSGHAAGLFTVEDKRDEPGIAEAARRLGLPLVFLPRAALTQASPRLMTRSALVEARFGVGSVAEAAALAGAGPRSRLIAPRASEHGAACAIAAEEEFA